jgi:hypothetical protein
MNRDIKLNLRVSEYENNIIKRKAEKANASISSYIRSAALGKEIINIDGLREMLPELNRIGNNLNQTTILLRQNKITNPHFLEMKSEFTRLITDIENKLKGW